MKYKLSPIFIFLFLTSTLWSQQTDLDSLKLKTYDELKYVIEDTKDKGFKLNCIQAFLEKAKKDDNLIKITDGFKLLSKENKGELKLKYLDSIILITKNLNHKEYPAKGYLIKGNALYELGKYTEALDQYLTALSFAKTNENEFQKFAINFNIGLLKNILGDRDEAKKIFEYAIEIIEQNKSNEKYFNVYNRVLYALADSYAYSEKYDLANQLTKKGIKYSIKNSDKETYSYLVMNSGVYNFFNKKYKVALDSLTKAKKLLQEQNNQKTRIALCDYYIGKTFTELNEKPKSIYYFQKVDSILNLTNDVTPELIDTYNYLINDAVKNKDLIHQIKYINSLIKYDSILDNNYKYLKHTISKKYDTPELIDQKEKLISILHKKETKLNNRVILLIIILIISILILYYFVRKNILNRKKYDLLIQEIKSTQKNKTVEISDIGISEHVINDILTKLENFEASDKFISKFYTLNSLSKELNTNSSYLSKVINVTRETNFTQYLNDLKIDFTVKKLSSDKRFRSYTIKAISEESGFNNAQSFSAAFHKKTGIYPSYFIKKLNNEN